MESSQIIEHQRLMNGYTPHQFHNSRPAINKVGPDILYYIFKSAVYESSTTPVQTALNISHVCRYWRNTALESPILWRTIDLDSPRSIVDLFVSRSENVPLIMSWTNPIRCPCTECSPPPFEPLPRKIYRDCIADPNRVLPRLCSLTLHLRYSELDGFRHVFQNPEVPSLQLRHLDVQLLHDEDEQYYHELELTDLVQVDPSYLQELILQDGVNLPWIELPPTGTLTHFTLLLPSEPPTLSHLLKFLSTCPSLCDLRLGFDVIEEDEVDTTDSDPIIKSITRLDFPKLQRLKMEIGDATSYVYIREISARIRTVTSLSELAIESNNCLDSRASMHPVEDTTTHNIFETIPSEALSNFTGHRCLRVTVENKVFEIFSAPDNHPGRRSDEVYYPFQVSGSFPLPDRPTWFDGLAPILDMIRAMPMITDLGLVDRAWQLPWVTDIPNLFPCLDTLRLDVWWHHDITPVLNSLPASLKLKKLVVTYNEILPVDVLLDAVSRVGAEILELTTGFTGEDRIQILETILSERGVEFVRLRRL